MILGGKQTGFNGHNEDEAHDPRPITDMVWRGSMTVCAGPGNSLMSQLTRDRGINRTEPENPSAQLLEKGISDVLALFGAFGFDQSLKAQFWLA